MLPFNHLLNRILVQVQMQRSDVAAMRLGRAEHLMGVTLKGLRIHRVPFALCGTVCRAFSLDIISSYYATPLHKHLTSMRVSEGISLIHIKSSG